MFIIFYRIIWCVYNTHRLGKVKNNKIIAHTQYNIFMYKNKNKIKQQVLKIISYFYYFISRYIFHNTQLIKKLNITQKQHIN